jgi:hypothetical protein
MKRTAIVLVAALLFPAGSVFAQGNAIEYSGNGCIRAGQPPLMQLSVEPKGELRGYFRRINTTDWCSVEGKNLGPLSNVVLPKFEAGDEIEYFFVVLNGKKVVAKSPRVYRAKATEGCESEVARHMLEVSIDCSRVDDVIPASLEAGYKIPVSAAPGPSSPASPARQ